MNNATQTLLRSILKFVASYLATRGFLIDDSTVEIIIAGVLAAGGVIWGLAHRTNNKQSPGNSGTALPSNGLQCWLALLLILPGLLGCSVVRVNTIRPSGEQTSVTCYVPAWPWQDSARTIERLSVSTRTNSASISLKGLDESETTSTNAVTMVENVAGAMMGAAVKALK